MEQQLQQSLVVIQQVINAAVKSGIFATAADVIAAQSCYDLIANAINTKANAEGGQTTS